MALFQLHRYGLERQVLAPIEGGVVAQYKAPLAARNAGEKLRTKLEDDAEDVPAREEVGTESAKSGLSRAFAQPLNIMANQTILIADDSADDLITTRYALQQARILNPLRTVTSGTDALCYLKGEALYADRTASPFPVLLLLDWKMPGLSGEAVLLALRQYPHFRPRAVVILTGLNALPDIRRAYALGANSFLAKPLMVEDLLNVLRGLHRLGVVSSPEGHRLDIEPGLSL